MAEGHFQGIEGSPRGRPQRSINTPAPGPVEEEEGGGKVFLQGCTRGLSKVCEEKVRRKIEMERKREREEKAVMYMYERHDVFVIKMFYLFYLSLFIKICYDL